MISSLRHALLPALAGLIGAAGVALAAVAAHGRGETQLAATAAGIALVHAPALLALSALSKPRFSTLSGCLLALGVVLFSGDLAKRFFLGERLFEGAAPTGGMLMIAGWLLVTLGALAALWWPEGTGERT